MVLVAGCQAKSIQAPDLLTANFDFELPSNYQIADVNNDRCAVLKEDVAVDVQDTEPSDFEPSTLSQIKEAVGFPFRLWNSQNQQLHCDFNF